MKTNERCDNGVNLPGGEGIKPDEMVQNAIQRANIYGFLASIYYKEITPDFLAQLKNPDFSNLLSNVGIDLGREIFNEPEQKVIEELAVEYARLFIGPGHHISPHESIHHERDDGDWGKLWGKDTVLVKNFIETAGLQYNPTFTGMPDHISAELEFMQKIIENEAQAWRGKDYDGASYCLKVEKKFMDEHLIKWIPRFCDNVISQAELSFYREIAKLTKDFIEFDKGEIDNYISTAQRLLLLG